jgi:poly-gamma-glutamate synthesis protein (capsule biosynthesis protein)
VTGAGHNLRVAQMPAVSHVNGRRIVIYAMAEREFSVGGEDTPGANPLDLISFVQAVRQYKQDGTFIVFGHGGKEHYPYPTPEMVRRSRFMVDMGADAVIWSHTHCPLPWETYAGRPIIYGLGNLVFEPLGTEQPMWHQGYLARLEIDGCEVRFEPIPYTQSLHAIGATSMKPSEALALHRELLIKGEELQDDALMASKWKAACQLHRVDYLSMLFASSPALSRFQRLLMPLHARKAVLQSLLLVQCETHREILETLFSDERSRG